MVSWLERDIVQPQNPPGLWLLILTRLLLVDWPSKRHWRMIWKYKAVDQEQAWDLGSGWSHVQNRETENSDWSFNLLGRCDVHSMTLLFYVYHSMTLSDFLAPVLTNLPGHEPGKSVYLGLGTVTQVPYAPCMCFPFHFYTSKYILFSLDKRGSTQRVSFSIP